LRRLTIDNENHFTRFEAAEEAITTMRDLASPVGAFVREKCELGFDDEIAVDELYAAYKDWCQVCEYPKSPKAHFGRDLRAACPSVRKTRPREPDGQPNATKRPYVYAGIRLRTEGDDEEGAPDLPLSKADNGLVARTTRTTGATRGAFPASGPSGPSDQLNVALSAGRSDDLPCTGPVTMPPAPKKRSRRLCFFGTEPFQPCAHCGKTDGVIHHVQDDQHLNRPSINLHEECIEAWLKVQDEAGHA
jgi:hypothetical protein